MMHLFSAAPALDLEVDLQPPVSGKIGTLDGFSFSPGGKAVNLARCLRAWGTPYKLTLGVGGGKDPSHVLYDALLRAEGLEASFLDASSPIRLNLVTRMDRMAGKYNHPGYPLSMASFKDYGRCTLSKLPKGSFWVLSGRIPKGLSDKVLRDCFHLLQSRGVRCVVDTSGWPLRTLLSARPAFLKVNLHEMGEAVGHPFKGLDGLIRHLPRLQSMGLLHGAVTDGPRGAVVWEDAEVVCVRPPKMRSTPSVVVGAGDAFLAGYLWAWQGRKPLAERAVCAVAAGARVARSGILGFDPKKVGRLCRQVTFV